jgi:glycogen debranching enzyme
MIALPGLCIATGRFDIARSILQAFAGAVSQGMIPNRFPDAGDMPDYNTVDATLWFIHAAARYIAASGDNEFAAEIYPVLRDCLEWHWHGTRYGIVADESDEIQALWFNALKDMMTLSDAQNDAMTKKRCGQWSRKAKVSFAPLFWNEDAGCLFDCVNDGGRDGAIRPNQIFVVSLPHRLLSTEQEKRVVATVQRELLTPVGLRSLSRGDAQYRGIYIGDQWQRDSSYHQGTVWGWPIGGFFSAYLKVNRHSTRAKAQVRTWMEPLQAHLDTAGLGSISEIFDGDAPHTPRGCFAQAWSVSEPLRVLLDEL